MLYASDRKYFEKEKAMLQNLINSLAVSIPVGILTGVIVFIRGEQFVDAAQVAAKGLAAARLQVALGYFIGAVVFGAIAVFTFQWMAGRWPENYKDLFLKLAIGLGIFFTVLAIVVCPLIKLNRIPEFTIMHVFYAAGFGWIMPMLLKV